MIWGEATIDAGKIAVKASQTRAPKHAAGPGMCQARHIIAATDARPPALPDLEPDKKLDRTDSEAMNPDKMPRSPLADAEISAFARKAFENHAIRIMTGTKVTKLDKKSDSVIATFKASGKTEQWL